MKVSPLGTKLLWRSLRIAGLLAGLGFMAWLLLRLLRDPQLLKNQFAIPGFLEAVAVGVVANAAGSILFSDMVSKSVPGIAIGKRLSAYYYSQVAKYIPGRVAALLVQRSILAGPRATVATVMSNIELTAITGWLCSSAALVLLTGMRSVPGAAVLAVGAVCVGTWLIRMDWLPLMHRVLRRIIPAYRSSGELPTTKHQSDGFRAAVLSTALLVLPAASSYLLLVRGMNVDNVLAVPLTALLLLSWVGGMLAFVFPAGIGVRELIFIGLGGALWQAPAAELMAGIALASRLIQVLADVAGVLLFVLFQRFYGIPSETHDER
jgi:hypothetical protein